MPCRKDGFVNHFQTKIRENASLLFLEMHVKNCFSPIETWLVLAFHLNKALQHQRNLLSIYLKVHLLNIVNYIKGFVFLHETNGWIWTRTFKSRVWLSLNVSWNNPACDWQCVSVHKETVWTWPWLWLCVIDTVNVYCRMYRSVHFIACHFHLIHRKDPNIWTTFFSSNIKNIHNKVLNDSVSPYIYRGKARAFLLNAVFSVATRLPVGVLYFFQRDFSKCDSLLID